MRVLHLLKTSTGAVWALRQVRELVRLGVDVHVALPPGGKLYKEYRKAGAETHPLVCEFPAKRPWLLPRRMRELNHLVGSVEPDVVHSHFVATTLTMRLALGKRPTPRRVFQVPGPLHLEHPLVRSLELYTANEADHWIASCDWTRRRYVSLGVPANRVSLSYYGIDLPYFTSGNPGKLRSDLAIDPKIPIVGMVAYIYPPKWYLGHRRGIKGHEDLIDAMQIVKKRGIDFHVVFAGGAWAGGDSYQQRLQHYAQKRLGRKATFLGHRIDMADLFCDFQLAVYPSHSENIGGSVEALSAGVPCVSTAVGGIPEVVIDGRTGWLVPPKNPAKLAEAIAEALCNPGEAKRRALAGQAESHRIFDTSQSAAQIAQTYEEILGDEQEDMPSISFASHATTHRRAA